MFYAPWFLIAGMVAAAGPVLIHLLNRQRYRVLEWAAMDFLRQAIHRSRRWLRLRDLVLLLVRTGCILAFALALAQPYRLAAPAAADPNQPVHAVFIVDNSLSMGYEQLGRTLLDEAKAKLAETIRQLPTGSVISIVPLCGHRRWSGPSPAYRTKEDALDALAGLEVVDREGTLLQAIELARQSCARVAQPTVKQIVLFTDHQALPWRAANLEQELKRLPGVLQVVRLGPENRPNAWVESLEVVDGLADGNVPTHFLARVRYGGDAPRHDVQVTLQVEGASVASQRVSLLPGQTAEVRFPPYRFAKQLSGGQLLLAPVEVQISSDHLAADDRRCLAVPVAAGLPVVFVDSLGPAENPRLGRYGETYRLRRLLAPGSVGRTAPSELVEVRHVNLAQLESEGRRLLQDARAVVMAGLPSPGTAVPLLREYVQQGGTLLIAAGGQFDPQAWNQSAWLGGLGILPAPLKPQLVGRTPQETLGRIEPFFLDFASLMGEYFFLEQEPEENLKELYNRVFFFKAAAVDDSPQARQELLQHLAQAWQTTHQQLQHIQQELAALRSKPLLSEADRQRRLALEQQQTQLVPQWLLWAEAAFGPAADPLLGESDLPILPTDAQSPEGPRPEQLLQRMSFTTLARYTKDQLPFLVQRRIGRGRVLFVSSGVFRDWNNMTAEYAVVVFDRILRRALQRSFPPRTLSSSQPVVIPVAAAERSARVLLTDPEGKAETLAVEALAADRYGIRIPALGRRGIWWVNAYHQENLPATGGWDSAADSRSRSGSPAPGLPETKLWQTPLAVNGPAEESDLTPISDQDIFVRAGSVPLVLRESEEAISVSAAAVWREDYWRWLIGAVLVGLGLEGILLAWPVVRGAKLG